MICLRKFRIFDEFHFDHFAGYYFWDGRVVWFDDNSRGVYKTCLTSENPLLTGYFIFTKNKSPPNNPKQIDDNSLVLGQLISEH